MFKNLKTIPYDPIFKLMDEYSEDQRENKVNLGIGIYTDDNGKPFVLPTIKEAATKIDRDNFNYDPLSGNQSFLKNIEELFFPDTGDLFACQQACGGTHGLSIAGKLLMAEGYKDLIVGLPTWDNYYSIFHEYNFFEYDYFKPGQNQIDIESLKKAIIKSPEKSVLLLQGGLANNPTGLNLSIDDLKSCQDLIREKEIYLIIDFAYLGLAEGFSEDLLWLSGAMELFEDISVVISFSKNATLYKHRLGALFVKTEDKELVVSNLRNIIRQTISMAPSLGSDIMNIVLRNCRAEWLNELETMRQSINERRRLFAQGLDKKYAYLADGFGMFGLLDLDQEQIERLKKEFGIYMLNTSRINFGGLKNDKIDFITDSINKVL